MAFDLLECRRGDTRANYESNQSKMRCREQGHAVEIESKIGDTKFCAVSTDDFRCRCPLCAGRRDGQFHPTPDPQIFYRTYLVPSDLWTLAGEMDRSY